jgi:hypothetical protein
MGGTAIMCTAGTVPSICMDDMAGTAPSSYMGDTAGIVPSYMAGMADTARAYIISLMEVPLTGTGMAGTVGSNTTVLRVLSTDMVKVWCFVRLLGLSLTFLVVSSERQVRWSAWEARR